MSKILKNIILIIGAALLAIVIILNLIYTSKLSEFEEITTNTNGIMYLMRSITTCVYYL